MKEYHKVATVYERDPETKFKKLVEGKYANPALEYLAMNKWVFTEKVDGTNIRIMLPPYQEDGKQFGITFGGKTDEAQIPAKLVARLDEIFRNDAARAKLAEMFPDGGCLYGEGFGAGIQAAGKHYAPEQDFVLFDVLVRTKCDRHRATQTDLITPRDSASPVTTHGGRSLSSTKQNYITPLGDAEIQRQEETFISEQSSASTSSSTTGCSSSKEGAALSVGSQKPVDPEAEVSSRLRSTTTTEPEGCEAYSAAAAMSQSIKLKPSKIGSKPQHCTCGEWWLERHNVEDVAHDLGLKIVPIIGTGTLPEMVQKAKIGFASQWGNFNAEGIVARPACELKTRNGARIITKIKHKDF